jgi:RNA polymerase sigma-70 factor, ECF subfamily
MDNDAAKILIEGIVKGDAEAEKKFFSGFRDEVVFFVKLKIGRGNQDWKDLEQEIFIDLFRRIRAGDYDHRKGSVGAFVQSTTKFKIMDYLKSRHYRARAFQSELTETNTKNQDEDPVALLISAEEIMLFEKALRELPEPYRTILVSFFFKGLKIKEIAAELGLDEQKVSNYKSYALSLIKKRTVI